MNTRPYAQPPALKFVTDWLAPVNTITILGVGLADLFTPWLGKAASLGLIAASALALATLLMTTLARSGAAQLRLGVLLRQRSVLAAVAIIALAFCVLASKAALAAPSGLAAALAPDVVRRLQQSLGLIEAQGQLTHRKLDEVQDALKDLKTDKLRLLTLIEQSRASHDRVLREASADYERLAQHQKDALALLRERQGKQMDARRMITLVRQYGSASGAQRPAIAETARRAAGPNAEQRLIVAMALEAALYDTVVREGAGEPSDEQLVAVGFTRTALANSREALTHWVDAQAGPENEIRLSGVLGNATVPLRMVPAGNGLWRIEGPYRPTPLFPNEDAGLLR